MIHKSSILIATVFTLSMVFQGCQTTPAQRGAMGGATVGAIAGQLIGGDTESTLLGAGAGALGGAIINDYRHQEKRRSYEKGYNDAMSRGYTPAPPPPPPAPQPYNTAPR